MKRHRVEWVRAAERDLERVIEFIAVDSVNNALAAAERIEAAAESLSLFPRRGHAVPELVRLGLNDWLELSVRPWRLVYRVRGQRVQVVALFDGRRDLSDVLFERVIGLDE